MIDGALCAYLSAYPGLVALVGDRVYADAAQQGTPKPYCVIVGVSDIQDRTLTGHSGAHEIRRQISCYAARGHDARMVEAQVVAALKTWRGSGVAGVFIEDRYTVPTEDENLFHRAVDTLILYSEE